MDFEKFLKNNQLTTNETSRDRIQRNSARYEKIKFHGVWKNTVTKPSFLDVGISSRKFAYSSSLSIRATSSLCNRRRDGFFL